MIKYRESFRIGKENWGIEDYKQPGDHFMPDKKHLRFKIWLGGCGVGEFDSIEESRQFIFDCANSNIRRRILNVEKTIKTLKYELKLLGDDSFNLGRFRSD